MPATVCLARFEQSRVTDLTLSITFENEHFVAVDKPSGWLSVPSRLGDSDERHCVGRVLEEQLRARLWPVHRLDLEVTGLLLFAKDAPAHKAANQWFEGRQVHKTYEAFTTVGEPVQLESALAWECVMMRGKKRAFISPHGKPSMTTATPKALINLVDGPALLWQLSPHTGRPHQLRFDLARHGYPIVGDKLYGSERPYSGGIALRCVRLDLSGCPRALDFGLPKALATTSLPKLIGLEV